MPATIGDILKTKPELITTTSDVMLHHILELMIHYDYSQLPVLDSDERPIGIVTSDGIVRALHHFGAILREPKKDDTKDKIRRLRAVDVMDRQVQRCQPDAEVFTVHRQLRDASCVLVVNERGVLKGIVTGYDTTEYLRQRVQDIVFVQDIEERIKDYVKLIFRESDGSFDEQALQSAIIAVTSSLNDQKKQLMPLLAAYLKLRDGDTTRLAASRVVSATTSTSLPQCSRICAPLSATHTRSISPPGLATIGSLWPACPTSRHMQAPPPSRSHAHADLASTSTLTRAIMRAIRRSSMDYSPVASLFRQLSVVPSIGNVWTRSEPRASPFTTTGEPISTPHRQFWLNYEFGASRCLCV